MRIDREKKNRFGKSEFVGDDEIGVIGRNVELAIVFELEQKRKLCCRHIGEIDADGRLDFFGLAGRLKVSVQDEIVAGIEAKSHACRLGLENRSRLPEKEMAVGIERFGFDLQLHAGKAGAWGFFLPPRGLGTVDDEVCVMDETALAGANLNRFDPSCFFDGRVKNEIPIDVAAAGGNFEGRFGAKDQIRLAELPAGIEVGSRREVGGGTFGHAGINPFLKQGNFIWRKMQIVIESPFARLGQPWRHDAFLGEIRRLTGMRFEVAVGEQGKRSGFARMVARRARAEDDGSKIAIECDWVVFV